MTRRMFEEDRKELEVVCEINALSEQILKNFDRGFPSPRLMDGLKMACADLANSKMEKASA